MSTQILLNPIGSGGDVFPYLALGMELQKRGHHVAVMTNRMFIENVGQANLEFIEIGSMEALRSVGKNPGLHRADQAWKLALQWGAVGTLRQTFDVIQARIKKCDTMLVAPPIGLGARVAAEKFKIPLATIVLSPFLIRSTWQSPMIKPMLLGDWVPKISKRFQYWCADRFVIDPLIKAEIEALRRVQALPPVSRYLHRWCFSNELTLGLFPELFAPPQPDWPNNIHLTGPIFWDPTSDLSASKSLEQFIDPVRKPIVVLAGSAGPESLEFVKNWIAASRQLNRQLILLEKNQRMVPEDLPNHVFHAEYFPIDDLASRAAVVCHAGGVGATLRVLATGTPQLLFPKVNDQPDNALRIKRLGAGKSLRSSQLSVNGIVSAVSELLSDTEVSKKCLEYKRHWPDVDAVKISCDLIEEAFDESRA